MHKIFEEYGGMVLFISLTTGLGIILALFLTNMQSLLNVIS